MGRRAVFGLACLPCHFIPFRPERVELSIAFGRGRSPSAALSQNVQPKIRALAQLGLYATQGVFKAIDLTAESAYGVGLRTKQFPQLMRADRRISRPAIRPPPVTRCVLRTHLRHTGLHRIYL